jgi:hypothetical protein
MQKQVETSQPLLHHFDGKDSICRALIKERALLCCNTFFLQTAQFFVKDYACDSYQSQPENCLICEYGSKKPNSKDRSGLRKKEKTKKLPH